MQRKRLVAAAVATALALLAAPSVMGAPTGSAAAVIASGADPLLAVEASRGAIIDRLTAEYAAARQAAGVSEEVFRGTLQGLRADQLLAATLVGSFAELTTIVTQTAIDGAAASRYVAVTPTNTLASLPAADGYVVRTGETLSVVKAADLQLGASTQLVGYFMAGGTTVVAPTAGTGVTPKDGSGSGANSWIGYTAGSNLASGTGSAVAAGTFNNASGTNAAVFGGQSNAATGISSLVIGGFDNRATAIDSLVGAGAGNRATGARSVVIGGGYNLASGQWSFVGGGGRQTGAGVAGAAAQDNIASGFWSTVVGGTGNRATSDGAFVGGGGFNVASGMGSFIGGGSICCSNGSTTPFPNIAAGRGSSIVGGYSNQTNGAAEFIGGGFLNSTNSSYAASVLGGYNNVASGQYAAVLGGQSNVASGFGSVAAGQNALTQSTVPVVHDGTFVFSDGSSGNFRSTAGNTFNVLATGGVTFITAAANPSGEAIKLQSVNITPAGELTFPEEDRQQIRMRSGSALQQGMGGQTSNLYFRSNSDFAWFQGGSHSTNYQDPGVGGAVLATLQVGVGSATVTGTFRAQSFTATSDRNAKTDFVPLDAKAILNKVAQMPITTWSYKNEKDAGIRHIGPVAQDFQALFAVGYDDKSIATVDADGVAFAAIKGLQEEIQERDATIALQQVDIDGLRAQLTAQKQRLAALEQQIGVIAATQLQVQDLAQLVVKLQQEMALRQEPRQVATKAP